MNQKSNISTLYLASWFSTISIALCLMYYLQGDNKDLYVSDQFYYFEMISTNFEDFSENLDPRYFTFIAILKILQFLTSNHYLLYFIYVLTNGVILMMLCRGFKKSHIFFFSISYIYLSHGLFRDQFILALIPLITKSRFFLIEIAIVSLRAQLLLLLDYKNIILNIVLPATILFLASWYTGYQPSLSVVYEAVKSLSTLAGRGFLTTTDNFPLVFVVLRMILGCYMLLLIPFLLVNRTVSILYLYKYFIFITCYALLEINMDIRIHITAISLAIAYFERTK